MKINLLAKKTAAIGLSLCMLGGISYNVPQYTNSAFVANAADKSSTSTANETESFAAASTVKLSSAVRVPAKGIQPNDEIVLGEYGFLVPNSQTQEPEKYIKEINFNVEFEDKNATVIDKKTDVDISQNGAMYFPSVKIRIPENAAGEYTYKITVTKATDINGNDITQQLPWKEKTTTYFVNSSASSAATSTTTTSTTTTSTSTTTTTASITSASSTTTGSAWYLSMDIKFGMTEAIEYLPDENGEMLYISAAGFASVRGPEKINSADTPEKYTEVKQSITESLYKAIENTKGASDDISKLSNIIKNEVERIYNEEGYFDKTGYLLDTVSIASIKINPKSTSTPQTTNTTTVLPTTSSSATTTTTSASTTTAAETTASTTTKNDITEYTTMLKLLTPGTEEEVDISGFYARSSSNFSFGTLDFDIDIQGPTVIEKTTEVKSNIIIMKFKVIVPDAGISNYPYTVKITKALDKDGNDIIDKLPWKTREFKLYVDTNKTSSASSTTATTTSTSTNTTTTTTETTTTAVTTTAVKLSSGARAKIGGDNYAQGSEAKLGSKCYYITAGQIQEPEKYFKEIEFEVEFDDPNMTIIEKKLDIVESAGNILCFPTFIINIPDSATVGEHKYKMTISKAIDINDNDITWQLPWKKNEDTFIVKAKDNSTTTASTTATTGTTTTTTTTTDPTGELQLGDVNGDNTIDARDATNVLTYYAKSSINKLDKEYTGAQKKAADYTKDGIIDARDATAILTYYAKSSTDNNN